MGRAANSIEHILSNTIRDEESGCLLYTLSVNEKGYPLASFKDKTCRASRLVYQMWHGEIPKGTDIDHVCYNRRCLEPTHLRALSHRENVIHIKAYVEKRHQRIKQLIESYPQIKHFPILITLEELEALWDCGSTAHVKARLRTMSRAYPEEFFYERFAAGRGRNPDLYAIGIHASLIDKLSNEDKLRVMPAEDLMTLVA